jgi:hypothetical protein
MTLKHTFTQVLRSGRIVPKLLWDVLKDLDSRITTLSNSAGVDVTTITGDVTINSSKVSAIGASKVKSANMAIFVSTVQTANGSAQNVAHSLGVSPTTVLVIPVSTLAGATAFSFTKGSTNVVVTGTNTATYMVLAIA